MSQQTLVTFKSRAAADVTMLSDHAQALLSIVGKTLGERGVITAEQIPGALSALKGATAKEDANPEPHDQDDEEARRSASPPVKLSQRAWPLIDMLERAGREGTEVLWGV